MTNLHKRTILEKNALFIEFKGALTEQFVLQQMKTIRAMDIYYWSNDRGGAEVDFVVSDGEKIVPVEVKAELNLQAKSLKTYIEKYVPPIAIRSSMTNYKREETLINLPLYAIGEIYGVCFQP